MAEPVKFLEELGLDLKLLGGSLNHKVASSQRSAVHPWSNAFQRRVARLGSELAFRHLALQVLADGAHGAVEEGLFHVHQHHAISSLGENVGNAITHGASAHNADGFNFHDCLERMKNASV